MKLFTQWCEDAGHDLKSILEVIPAEKATSESGGNRRQRVRSHELPPAAGRGQYPAAYFMDVPDNLVYNKDKK